MAFDKKEVLYAQVNTFNVVLTKNAVSGHVYARLTCKAIVSI